MAHNSRTDIWLGLVIAAVTVLVVKTYNPNPSANVISSIEPAAGVEADVNPTQDVTPVAEPAVEQPTPTTPENPELDPSKENQDKAVTPTP